MLPPASYMSKELCSEREKFITRQASTKGGKDDYDSEIFWILDGLPAAVEGG